MRLRSLREMIHTGTLAHLRRTRPRLLQFRPARLDFRLVVRKAIQSLCAIGSVLQQILFLVTQGLLFDLNLISYHFHDALFDLVELAGNGRRDGFAHTSGFVSKPAERRNPSLLGIAIQQSVNCRHLDPNLELPSIAE